MRTIFSKVALLSLVFAPSMAFAEDLVQLASRLLRSIGDIVSIATPIVFGMALLAFFWGIFRYVFSQNLESKQEGKGVMLWALIALFVMASLFGIIRLLQNTLGVGGSGDFNVPSISDSYR